MGAIKFNRASGKPIVSERLGRATGHYDHRSVCAFRALAGIRCALCHEWIKPGALFIRRPRPDAPHGAAQHQSVPTCRACYPFDVLQ